MRLLRMSASAMMREMADRARMWGPVVFEGETIRKSRKRPAIS